MQKITNFLKFKVAFPSLIMLEKLIGRFSVVGDPAIFNSGQFAWTQMLESNWETIRKELDEILIFHDQLPNLQDIQDEQYEITRDDKWKTFIFYGFGHKVDLNCSLCPKTAGLVEKIPNMVTAFFSILSPEKHIPRHRGVYKGLIRSHLGLKVPSPKGICRMKVSDQTVEWEEGKMVVFDNTCFHEVWNDSDETRVVLLIDVIRPFRFPVSILNEFIIKLIRMSSYVKNAQKKHKVWEMDFIKNKKASGINSVD